MYSANGRRNNDKESASRIMKSDYVIVCSDCGHEMHVKTKEFGEEFVCDECQSGNLVTTKMDE
jgi:DNA-directed RNA polymerase subunit RPC12/RpoP